MVPDMTTLETRLTIAEWDEKPVAQWDDAAKITRANVELTDGSDGLERGRFESVMYYRPDGTAAYVNMMHLTARLEGRSGTFVLAGEGTYDGTTASGTSRIVTDSGTGELVGITGTISSASTEADYPHMPLTLDYHLP
jgi:hypothetical protein